MRKTIFADVLLMTPAELEAEKTRLETCAQFGGISDAETSRYLAICHSLERATAPQTEPPQ